MTFATFLFNISISNWFCETIFVFISVWNVNNVVKYDLDHSVMRVVADNIADSVARRADDAHRILDVLSQADHAQHQPRSTHSTHNKHHTNLDSSTFVNHLKIIIFYLFFQQQKTMYDSLIIIVCFIYRQINWRARADELQTQITSLKHVRIDSN